MQSPTVEVLALEAVCREGSTPVTGTAPSPGTLSSPAVGALQNSLLTNHTQTHSTKQSQWLAENGFGQ